MVLGVSRGNWHTEKLPPPLNWHTYKKPLPLNQGRESWWVQREAIFVLLFEPWDVVTTFRWKRFGQWVLVALGLIVLGTFLLMGVPGMFVYLVWQVLLNVIFQRVVIAEPPEGGGMWVVGIVLSFLTPLGLPLGYIVASLLPTASLQRLPFLRHRLTWLVLFALLWSLLLVIWINPPAGEAKNNKPLETTPGARVLGEAIAQVGGKVTNVSTTENKHYRD